MKKKIILSSIIGAVLGVLYELLWMWRKEIFLTHDNGAIVSRIITAFIEGTLLFLIVTWRDRLLFKHSLKSYLLNLIFIVMYYYVREITVTLSLFISILPSALIAALIMKLTGIEVSSEITIVCFTVIIDVAFLLLIFYPLLSLGKKWVDKDTEL